MNHMKFEPTGLTSENIDKIVVLFPNCVTEMRDECYEFTWVGKKASIVFEIFKLYMPEDANDISKRVRVI